ncbi:MAG: preprotein translocase subunit SecY [Proteobacteria bacterium]|nr:preprotein translocase subunit SecY [Pseudomonadota bacterium]
MVGGLADILKIPELKKRVLFTLGMLAVYRLGVFVSTPGVDVEALRRMFQTSAGTLFGFINLCRKLRKFIRIAPYISVSIIIQMLTPTIPALEALKKEGESGQRVLTRYTRYGTIALALFQGFMIAVGLEKSGMVVDPGLTFRLSTMITLTTGTAFMMWIGEQITERGLGNGISIIIFAGIIARMPSVFAETIALSRTGDISPASILLLIGFSFLTVVGIIFVERAQRRIPIQYPRRAGGMGRMAAQPQTQYMPLRLNMSGVYPPIFASALLVVPATIASFGGSEMLQDFMAEIGPGRWLHDVIFVALILVFSFFFTAVIFNPVEIADNLKKNGGFVPTVRPGKETSDYLYSILNRLTVWGAIYLCLVCLLPQHVYVSLGAHSFAAVFGGTAVLIAVGVTLDTISQVESYVVARNYESFMSRSTKVRAGVGSMSYMRTRVLKR